jgi:hypothetical protein
LAPRLKVFVTSDGLTDYVVATSSRPKALAAWGAHQDLFKTGGARETDDPALVQAALAAPGEVLRKPANTSGKLAKIIKAKRPKPKGPSKALLKKIEGLEARLGSLETARTRAADRLEAARAELDEREARETAKFDAEARRLKDALSEARRQF